jgi:hypothetical protein
MQRRTLLAATVGALVTAGCMPEGKVLQVSAPPTAPPSRKIERVLVWLPPQEYIARAKLGDAFVSAFAPYGVQVRLGRAIALELNRGDDQAPLMNELKATHRLEVEVAYYREGGSAPGTVTFAAVLYAGTSRTPLMTLHYRPAALSDYSLADVVVQKLRERGYL